MQRPRNTLPSSARDGQDVGPVNRAARLETHPVLG